MGNLLSKNGFGVADGSRERFAIDSASSGVGMFCLMF